MVMLQPRYANHAAPSTSDARLRRGGLSRPAIPLKSCGRENRDHSSDVESPQTAIRRAVRLPRATAPNGQLLRGPLLACWLARRPAQHEQDSKHVLLDHLERPFRRRWLLNTDDLLH